MIISLPSVSIDKQCVLMLLRDDVSTCAAPEAEDPLWIKRGGIKTSYGRHVNSRRTMCNPLRESREVGEDAD